MLRTFIQVSALTAVLMSSFFLIRGTLYLSKKDIAELASTKWAYNLDVAKNLCHQRSDTIVGFTLLLLSFALQMGNLLWALRWCDFKIEAAGVIIALIVSAMLSVAALSLSNHLYKTHYHEVEPMLKRAVPEPNQ